MCGICGVFNPGRELPVAPVEVMVAALAHRGPDAHGVLPLDGAVLGHTRLSVIDLATGDQPLGLRGGRWWISFNGEIYNYRQLRSELEREGTVFHTASDTEVVLAAYARWGRGCLDRLRGMFAFLIWDSRERSLFAARDPFGEKPLFYALCGDNTLAAASEIKALSASGLLVPRLDLITLDAFLELGYVPPDRTVYRGVCSLPPGHCLEWSGGAEVRTGRYWSPRPDSRPLNLSEASERLRELLAQAVRRQLVADVPLGAFLSGGLDSSTLVALMQAERTQPVQTFAAGFGDLINELAFARQVAARYATAHSEIDLGAPPVAELLPRMCQVFDEPFADSSHLPTYMLAGFARQQVKVVLSGDGGDELFGGYSRYVLLARSERLKPSTLKWLVLRAASRLCGHRWRRLDTCSAALGLARRSTDLWERARLVESVFGPAERSALWGGRAKEVERWRPGAYYYPPESAVGLERAFHFDLTCYLPGDILVKVDRCSMAWGLETRAPFLDRDLAEFCLGLPWSLKVRDHETKVLLRRSFASVWPEAVRSRGKQGFGAPYGKWLSDPAVQALLHRACGKGSPLRELLPGVSPGALGRRDYRTWTLLNLGLWLESRAGTL
ncbi:asparagine synthase (glutamine-hydrolyzing) [bacterium]|nr:asparagine synthase (glutamine-hydrolyzing) [bacterium]